MKGRTGLEYTKGWEMGERMRKSGIDTIGDISWGTHICQFYQTKEDLMDMLVPYFRAGLENNEFCLWLTSQPIEVEAAKEALRKAIPDFNNYLEKGQIEIISCTNWYLKENDFDSKRVLNSWAEKLNQAIANGHDGLRLSENTFWLEKEGCRNGFDEYREIHRISGNYQIIALCSYSIDRCNAAEILDVLTNHQFALIKKEGKWQQVASFQRKCTEEILLRKEEELQEANKALQESEESFRTLAENSPDMIARFDRKNRHLYANPAAADTCGCSQEEIIGKSNSELGMNPEQVKFWGRHYEKVFATGKPEKIEFHYTSPQGKEYYLNTQIVPEFVDGRVTSILAISRDITDIKETGTKLKETLDNLENLVKERTVELEKAYNSLKESERSLAEAQKMAHIGNWDRNLITGESYWSEETYRIFRRSTQKNSVKYDEFLSYIHPDDRDYVDKTIQNRLKESPQSIDYRIILADGEERTIHCEAEVVFDEKNVPIKARGIIQDITERRKAEKALKLSEEKYRIIAEQTRQLVYDYDVEKNDVDWAGNIKEFTGYDPEEFKNITLSRRSRVHPEDLDRLQSSIKKYMKYGGTYRSEYRCRKKDGSYTFVEDSGVCLKNEKGKVNRVLGTIKDITERKSSQERLEMSERKYRSFIQNFKGIVYQADENFIPQFLHGAVEEITGYSKEEFMSELPWKEIIDPEYLPTILNEGIRLRTSPDVTEREFKIKNRTGKIKWIHETCQKIPGENGKPIYQGVIYDITERKQAEETLANIETARKKETHHRIKNNLQVISSLLDLEAEKFKNRGYIKDSELLEAFRESQDRIISVALIHEELHKGKGTDTLNFSPYLQRLAKNLFQTYRIGDLNVSLNIELEDNILFEMETAVPLGLIVNELVSNSLKYAFPGSSKGIIQIKLCREKDRECRSNAPGSKKENNKVTSFILTVSDNGVGIPESIDLENTDTLGLQLVTILVDQLGGKLELKRGFGTVFSIEFTVAEEH
ncbi:PAS domain S-box protein [Methanosarcina sp.]|uniref:PAS domain S-box protein n=1 Tax=Methanosarcina sp. TaxID=2213 RepID=UPI003C78A551